MLHIDIICVGEIKENYLKNAILEYSKRNSKYCILNTININDEKVPANLNLSQKQKIIQKESELMMSKIKANSHVIALDLNGKEYTSEEFAEKISKITLYSSHITFLIGGTLGMSKELLKRADELISFSKMTFPHQLIRVFLLEQLFRAFKINNNETYHH